MKKKFLVFLVMVAALCFGCCGLAWAAETDEWDLFQPNPKCGEYLGRNSEGVMEFNITIPVKYDPQVTPLVPGPFHTRHEFSDSEILGTLAQYYYGRKPGRSDVTYSGSAEYNGVYTLKAIVHVTVVSPEEYEALNLDLVAMEAANAELIAAENAAHAAALPKQEEKEAENTQDEPCANGHNWRALAQLPTDKADGRNYRKCSVCGLEELVSIIPRLNTQPEKQYVLPDANKIYSVNEVMKLLDDYPEGCPGNDNGSHLWRGRITTIPTLNQTGIFSYNCKGCDLKFDFKLDKSVSLYQIQGWAENNSTATNIEEVRALLAQNNMLNNNQQQNQQQQQQQQPAKSNDSGQSGSLSMSKLSQTEIKQLLANAPKTSFSDAELYAETPSYKAPYAAGRLNQAPLQATLARLNALRRIAGLPAVTLDDNMTEYAQQAALISAAYGTLNHRPSKPADMNNGLYQGAYKGASSSNLSAGTIFAATPDSWMDDSDASNIDRLGHRRWQLNPNMGKTGFGYVTTDSGYRRYAAEWSFDNTGGGFDYDFVAWPASGNFPSDVFGANVAWSVSVNPAKYQTPSQNNIKVTLTRESNGQQWTFSGSGYNAANSGSYFNVETSNYGLPNCIIFRPDGVGSYNGVYTVKIDGLRASNGQQTSLEYQVEFFGVGENTAAQPQPSQPDKPNNNQNQQNNNNNVNNNTNNNKNNNTNNNTNNNANKNTNNNANNNTNNTGNNKPNNGGINFFDPKNAVNPFRDVRDGDYFRDTVLWAVQRGVTKGTTATTFEPNTKCSNADIMTMLWRLYSGEEIAASNPFKNVRSSDYYYQPALWAYQLGMVTDKNFDWSAPCTRGATMRYIWIAAEKLQHSGSIPFTDVGDDLKMPVSWAWNAGIAKGTTATTFEPNATCTRAEIVTFLYRAFGGTLK